MLSFWNETPCYCNTVIKHEVCSQNMYTQHIFRIIMSNYDDQFTFNCTATPLHLLTVLPLIVPCAEFFYSTLISIRVLLPTVRSQRFPLRDVFKFLAAKT